jgi:hypothetical protein
LLAVFAIWFRLAIEVRAVPQSAQSDQQANARAKPQLALRVGVTGARMLDAGRLDDLRAKVHAALAQIRDEMMTLAEVPSVACAYANDGGTVQPLLRVVSPLALGSDRLVAEEALALGYALHVPMPFSRAEYELDFTGTMRTETPNVALMTAAEDKDEFERMIKCAGHDWMSLDGDYDKTQAGQDEQRNRAYEAVGRFVVRNSDIVIAIWNGELAAGRGGTQEIVDYAANIGVPVWWIHAAKETEPLWLADIQDVREPSAAPKAVDKIAAYLCQQICAPKPVLRNRRTGVAGLARLGQSDRVDPAEDYFKEQPNPGRAVWQLYNAMMRFASGCKLPWTPPLKPQHDAGVYWFRLYEPADARAGEYAARYRSSYVWIFLLTTLSLLFGALANMFHGHDIALFGLKIGAENIVAAFAGFELLSLLATLGIAIWALRHDWHERSIEYRLLAELCRKQQVLSPLGRAISFGAVQRVAAQIQEVEDVLPGTSVSGAAPPGREPDRAGWVSWLFMAYQRAAPLPRGNIASLLPGVLSNDVLQDLVDEQLTYHAARAQMAAGAAEYFEKRGGEIFVILLGCVLVKIVLTRFFSLPNVEWSDWTTAVLGLFGVVLPAVSAAAVGIGSYAEWQALAEESNHMLDLLTLAKKRIHRIDLRRPLASQDLGVEADSVASMMLQDLEGWQRLFRVKMIETQ